MKYAEAGSKGSGVQCAIVSGMDEQERSISVVIRLKKQLHHEIIFARGYAAMYREQYLEYLRELRKARWSKDYRRAAVIISDLQVSAEEAKDLHQKGKAAYQRLAALIIAQGFAPPKAINALSPERRFTRAEGDESEAVAPHDS